MSAADPRRAEALVDLAALRGNVGRLAEIAAPARVMLAVKADAYGHGMVTTAIAGLEAGATELAVLEIDAGLQLRSAGVTAPLFAWLHSPDSDYRAAAEAGVELGLSAPWQVERILASRAGKPAVVHLKIDTGLGRNGATAHDWPALLDAALEAERRGALRIRALWSHLADASVEDDEEALAAFHDAVRVAAGRGVRPEALHLAASSAGIRMPAARFDLVRFGIAAYGISPFDDASGADLGLTPVMTLRSHVTEVAPEADGRSSARVPLGFGDGLPPHPEGAEVLVRGRRRSVRRLEVDTLEIDADGPDLEAGDEVVLFGPGTAGEPTAEEWAGWGSTIGDEIVAALGRRVPRIYR